MKKKLIYITIAIIVGIVALFAIKYGNKIYRYYFYNDVLDYGKELTIYQILDDNIDISEYPQLGLEDYIYKKAKVKSTGNTAEIHIKLYDNEIVYIGNRSLIEINDVLYVYFEK